MPTYSRPVEEALRSAGWRPGRGRGRERAIVPFDLEPMLCDGEEGRFIDLSSDYGRQMFPIGVFDGMRYLLAMGRNG